MAGMRDQGMSEIRPEQIPTDLKRPAMDAGYPPDADPAPWPQQATVYGCPLSGCKWSHTEPHPTQYGGEGATIEECVTNTLRVHFAEVEAVVQAHLETHPLLEWVQEVTRLRDQIASTAPAAPVKRPAWDACVKSEGEGGGHSLGWYDFPGGACSWCGNVAERCPDCGVILTMHHDPMCSQPCGKCAERLSFGPGDLERYIAAAKRMQEDFAAKVSAMLPAGFYISFGERAE
jgi:hypothetical protein